MTLERRIAANDIADPYIPTTSSRIIPFSPDATLAEVEEATLQADNTSPGADSVTMEMLQVYWYILGGYIYYLFQACLSLSHHLKPFHIVEVVMLPSSTRGTPPHLAPGGPSFCSRALEKVRSVWWPNGSHGP